MHNGHIACVVAFPCDGSRHPMQQCMIPAITGQPGAYVNQHTAHTTTNTQHTQQPTHSTHNTQHTAHTTANTQHTQQRTHSTHNSQHTAHTTHNYPTHTTHNNPTHTTTTNAPSHHDVGSNGSSGCCIVNDAQRLHRRMHKPASLLLAARSSSWKASGLRFQTQCVRQAGTREVRSRSTHHVHHTRHITTPPHPPHTPRSTHPLLTSAVTNAATHAAPPGHGTGLRRTSHG